MDFQHQETTTNTAETSKGKRKSNGQVETQSKKQKLHEGTFEESKTSKTVAHQSPKKRLEFVTNNNQQHQQQHCTKSKKEQFIYGNYKQYYSYRNKGKVYHDIRLDIFKTQRTLFENKDALDIGCNSGLVTMAVAKNFGIKSIIGLDIDRSLINLAKKNLLQQKKIMGNCEKELRLQQAFPYNVQYVHGNYVLRDAVLLEIERPQFDLILCLSITKWIHLNFGDAGLKQTFRRMFLQLRNGGKLILEAQSFENYGRRKKMTDTIHSNYKAMQFFPQDFTTYLLSADIGFQSVELMGIPDHFAIGFKRPIQIFTK